MGLGSQYRRNLSGSFCAAEIRGVLQWEKKRVWAGGEKEKLWEGCNTPCVHCWPTECLDASAYGDVKGGSIHQNISRTEPLVCSAPTTPVYANIWDLTSGNGDADDSVPDSRCPLAGWQDCSLAWQLQLPEQKLSPFPGCPRRSNSSAPAYHMNYYVSMLQIWELSIHGNTPGSCLVRIW